VRRLGIVVGTATGVLLVARPTLRRVLARWLRVGRLAGRSGARFVTHRARRIGADEVRRAELDDAFQLRTAEDVARTLGQMKGAFMKVGQLVSFVDDGLPEHVRSALATLQDSAPPMSAALAAQVVRDELGADVSDLFRSWEATPIAAASIGQVHRAVMHDGRAVAVKVQYPGVADLMAADLAHLDVGRMLLPALYPHMNVADVTEELRDRLTEELDYTIEAANQRDFARWYDGHPFIRVPEVVDSLSTARVLTTAYAGGDRFGPFEQRASQDERDRAGEIIFRFVFRSLRDFLAFNGDPHPGNYLFNDDGSVTFLDFGLVKRLRVSDRDEMTEEIRHVAIDPDPAALRRRVEAYGFFSPGAPLSDEVIFEFSSLLWRHLVDDTPTTLTPEWASETVRTYLLKGPEFRELDKWGGLPRDVIILQRITVGLLAILGRLHATANWHRIIRELLFGEPPATPLGELEAEWLARSRAGVTLA
jgi:predicted unusual protein kinase regulating ubiquinone biosynthesis (AarF/ABC1/UbiB family)